MAQGDILLRRWNMLKVLQTRGEGLTKEDLSNEFNKGTRTIERDIAFIQELGFPIEHDEDVHGKRYWRMPADFFKTGPLVLNMTEAVSLYLADSLLTSLAGTHFADGLQSVLEKVRSIVPAKALDYFTDQDETLFVHRTGITDYRPHAETIRMLDTASRKEKTVEITYRAVWRSDEYTTLLNPYGMIYHNGDLFAVGFSHRAEGLRTFKINRIQQASVTSESFEKPDNYSLKERSRGSFGIIQSDEEPTEVVAKFYKQAALLVTEREWHESQQLQWEPGDDSLFEASPEDPNVLIASFQLSNMIEFKQWIRSFGDQAEILRPDWLREEMRAELQASLSRYE